MTRIEAEMSSQRGREMWSKMAEPQPAVIVFSVWAAAELCQLCPTVPEEGEGAILYSGGRDLSMVSGKQDFRLCRTRRRRREIDRQRYRERRISDGHIKSHAVLLS